LKIVGFPYVRKQLKLRPQRPEAEVFIAKVPDRAAMELSDLFTNSSGILRGGSRA
jgi:hypothetical protein